MGITVAAFGLRGNSNSNQLALYARTRIIDTRKVASSKLWNIVNMLHLGKTKIQMDGEKEGKYENAVIVAVVLSKDSLLSNTHSSSNNSSSVSVVGDNNEQDSSDDESSDDDDHNDHSSACVGQVVIMLATRTSLVIQKRIPLPPNFLPRVALHPSTYLNKIVLGGSTATSSLSTPSSSPLLLLNISTGKLIHVFSCLPAVARGGNYSITSLEQSPAVDTVAAGTSHGKVHLINLRHDLKLFTLHHYQSNNKKVGPCITSLSFRTDGSAMRYGIAPLAVGRSDGTVSIWDLTPPSKDDDDDDNDGTEDGGRRLLCDMPQLHAGGVAKLTYLPQEPLLLSTGSRSNSIQMHIFDNPDHTGRMLRHRSGHTSPPTCIRYTFPSNGSLLPSAMDGTDAASCQILSGGGTDRTLRMFSSARSILDKELSQGKGLEKKAKQLGLSSKDELLLPPITGMTISEARKRDWGDLVTIHRNSAFAYVWNSQKGSQSGPILRQTKWNVSAMAQKKPPESVHATCIAMSACGNFCLVGTKGGAIYKYNVQSGIPRGSYPRNETDEEDRAAFAKERMIGNVSRTMKKLEKQSNISNRTSDMDKVEEDNVRDAKVQERLRRKLLVASHAGAAVRGLAVDSLNKTLVSVGSDKKLILWSFVNHVPHRKSPHELPSPATKLCRVSDSDLAAIAMEDYSVILFDCSALSIVRRFGASKDGTAVGHTGPVTDVGFSPDGRSLFTSSLDSTVRVWDVPTNTCVDWLSFRTPPTALSLSPTGEFLATTHTGQLGISLWSDKSFYQTVHVDGAFPPSEPAPIEEDGYDSDEEFIQNSTTLAIAAPKIGGDDEKEQGAKKVPLPKEEGLITLSGLPPAHWKNLFHLELVKERNKPKEAPKKPPSAPFFLQWRSGETMGDKPADSSDKIEKSEAAEEEEWNAAWSDDEDANNTKDLDPSTKAVKRERGEHDGDNAIIASEKDLVAKKTKRRKVTHHRSHLAALLGQCERNTGSSRFQDVTDHLATLGPSGIDVALSTLCHGMHDLEEGLPLLCSTAMWLVEACQSRQRFEAVNAYLHRFLHLHSNVIAGIDDSVKQGMSAPSPEHELSEQERDEKNEQEQCRLELLDAIAKLREAQQTASDSLRSKMQHSLCLLRHFSRMV